MGYPNSSESKPDNPLRLLMWLRFVSIASQALAIGVVRFGLGGSLPLAPLTATLASLLIWNFATSARSRPTRKHVTHYEVFLHLVIDVTAFSIVLYFTGGPTNPFISLYLLPIALAATSLPATMAWTLAAICAAAYSVLWWLHVPLPQLPQFFGGAFNAHLAGMWVNFIVATALIVYFVGRISRLVRSRDLELASLREAALRDQQVVELGALAAGTAHELNTPLATLALLVEDLNEDASDSTEKQRLRSMMQEIDTITSRLSQIATGVGAQRSDGAHQATIRQFFDDLIERWKRAHPRIKLIADLDLQNGDAVVVAEATVIQAIRNVLDNAADASAENGQNTVELHVRSDDSTMEITVLDRGTGLPESIRTSVGQSVSSTKERGMGMGLLLSRSTLEKFGGALLLRQQHDGSVSALIRLPLSELLIDA